MENTQGVPKVSETLVFVMSAKFLESQKNYWCQITEEN
jgi:hypothetical protein